GRARSGARPCRPSPARRERAALLVARGRLDADDRALGELGEARGARVGRGAAQARRDLVEQVLDARTLGVEEHAAGADALLVEALTRALERRPAGRARRDRTRRRRDIA